MIHALHRVTDFQVIGPYRLRVSFRDGIVRDIDFQPVLAGTLFGPLRDPAVFNQVRLDPEVHTLVWPNGADFDPATLHDWPEMLPAIAERAKGMGSLQHPEPSDAAAGRRPPLIAIVLRVLCPVEGKPPPLFCDRAVSTLLKMR